MKKIPHPTAKVRLSHPDFPDGSRDLLVDRLRVDDPDNPGANTWALESAWEPDEGQLRALANGAPILLGVMGDGHPPVFLNVGEPSEDAVPTYLATHIERALGHLHAAMNLRVEDLAPDATTYASALDTMLDAVPPPDTFLRLWKEALQATIEPPTITIPDAPPEDLGDDTLRKDDDQ